MDGEITKRFPCRDCCDADVIALAGHVDEHATWRCQSPSVSYLCIKKTRKRGLLDEMDRVVPWSAPVQSVEPHPPRAKAGCPPLTVHPLDIRAGTEAALARVVFVADALRRWMRQQRQKIPDGSTTAKAIDYSLDHWPGLTHHLLDGEVSIDNNSIENLVRPWAKTCS